MTTTCVLKTLAHSGKPVSLTHLYRLFNVCNIKPLGRSRPQHYPEDAPTKILNHLGVPPSSTPAKPRVASGMVTVKQLRAAKLRK